MHTPAESISGAHGVVSPRVTPRGDRGLGGLHGSRGLAWRFGQGNALVLVVFFLVVLQLEPALALRTFWYGLVPILPASFLIQPAVWRNVCPLATLNTEISQSRRTEPSDWPHRLNGVGVCLLLMLIPARIALFNQQSGAVTTIVLSAIALVVASGRRFPWKAGFCNAICPMLPVERLYGLAPVVTVANARCNPCTLCTRRGCLDLAGGKSIAQLLGSARHSRAWLRTPFGAFAGAFPGVIAAYGLATSGGMSDWAGAYLAVTVGAGASWFVTLCVVTWWNVPWRRAVPLLAASAATLFYWFAAADCGEAWGLGDMWVWTMRAMALALIAAWFRRQWRGGPLSAGPERRSRSSLSVHRVESPYRRVES